MAPAGEVRPARAALGAAQHLDALNIEHLLEDRVGIHDRLVPIGGHGRLRPRRTGV